MKTKLIVAIGAVTLSCLSAPLRADQLDENAIPRDRNETQGSRMQKFGDVRKANHIIGMEIKNDQGETLGKVKDLALDLKNGRIVTVIVATGGALGMDQKLVAVPPAAFACDKASKTLRANLDKAQIKNAPGFQMAQWNEATQDSQVREVYQYYGMQPYYGPVPQSSRNINANSNDIAIAAARARADGDRGQDSQAYTFNGENAVRPGTNDQNYAGEDRIRPQVMGPVVRASKVIGSSTYNNQNEKLGKVENLMVDLPACCVVEVILASGGFLGIRGELSAVPPQAFQCDHENKRLTLDTTKEALTDAPHFKSTEWGYLDQPEHIKKVYGVYNVDPYFATHNIDNADRNVRDRSGDALTPFDQGNSSADRQTTAQIRKEIIAGKDLSMNARNVKIITVNGQVTLRGRVNTDDEKRLIGEIANRFAPSGSADNQLEVKLSPNTDK